MKQGNREANQAQGPRPGGGGSTWPQSLQWECKKSAGELWCHLVDVLELILPNSYKAKDVDWFLCVECLWAKWLHIVIVTTPYPYLDITYHISWIQPFYTTSRASQMCQICCIMLWGSPKCLESTLIPQLADFSFYMLKFIWVQCFIVYKLKCPRPVG